MSHANKVARDLGEALYPFGAEGVYGKFFQGEAEATLNKDFVVIETDHLRSHPDLLTVLVQMVMIHRLSLLVPCPTSRLTSRLASSFASRPASRMASRLAR